MRNISWIIFHRDDNIVNFNGTVNGGVVRHVFTMVNDSSFYDFGINGTVPKDVIDKRYMGSIIRFLKVSEINIKSIPCFNETIKI